MQDMILTDYDKALLSGSEGEAKKIAMTIMMKIAALQGAKKFIDVSRAHIDGCIYLGESSLLFASKLADAGGKVAIPTTLNAISVDRERWQNYGMDADYAKKASQLAYEYERMGAQPTFSCAPYQLPNAPAFGEHIAWAESNAIAYANGVLGARTNRYGDFMDICAALTGRAPFSGYHLDEERLGTMLIRMPADLGPVDSSLYPLLGYLIGGRVGKGVPVIEGLEHKPTSDDLKAFGAALATTGSVGMFHIVGVTPEASSVEEAFGSKTPKEVWSVTKRELSQLQEKLLIDSGKKVELVLLGSPQFSLEECDHLAKLVEGKTRNPDVRVIITTNSYAYERAEKSGAVDTIRQFGVEFLVGTCLCMIEPFIRNIIHNKDSSMMTNSGKFVHYGPGLTGEADVFLGSIEDCVLSAISGNAHTSTPKWLAT